jgi:hypothetical protein
MISPDARQYSPLSGGKSTYRSVQFSRASSEMAQRAVKQIAEFNTALDEVHEQIRTKSKSPAKSKIVSRAKPKQKTTPVKRTPKKTS